MKCYAVTLNVTKCIYYKTMPCRPTICALLLPPTQWRSQGRGAAAPGADLGGAKMTKFFLFFYEFLHNFRICLGIFAKLPQFFYEFCNIFVFLMVFQNFAKFSYFYEFLLNFCVFYEFLQNCHSKCFLLLWRQIWLGAKFGWGRQIQSSPRAPNTLATPLPLLTN